MGNMDLDVWAVLVAAVASFVIGGAWYGPLFGARWMTANGFDAAALRARDLRVVFGGSFALSLVAAAFLAAFVGPDAGVGFGAAAGAAAGIGWVATFTGIQYLFEMRRPALFLINAGYAVLTLTIMGAIIGAW